MWSRYRSFERVLEQPLAAAFAVLPEARLFLTEGNYLLMHDLAWTRVPAVMTEVWYVHLPADVRRRRLVDGHIMFGKRSEAALE